MLLAALGGSTVVVADHHLHLVGGADHVVDLGPDAGPAGGTVVFDGPPAELVHADTHTGRALRAWSTVCGARP